MKNIKIPQHRIERCSGTERVRGIQVIKRNNFRLVEGLTVIGDAPKVLVRIYKYSKENKYRKARCRKWPMYIVKTGHKWYPSETITERLLCRLGEVFGLQIAESDIAIIGGQVRFLSKYFLTSKTEELVHGADIFAGYIGDREFVEKIEEQEMARDLFTLQFVEKSIEYQFCFQKGEIMCELVKMLLFDILVGNNDRHFYNWAIIRSVTRDFAPRFSPVYDTARGLFWNNHDLQLTEKLKNNTDAFIKKYCNSSRPKLGWENEKNINHFKLLQKIYENEFYLTQSEIKALFLQCNIERMFHVIDTEFANLMSADRISMIKKCLEFRYNEIREIIK